MRNDLSNTLIAIVLMGFVSVALYSILTPVVNFLLDNVATGITSSEYSADGIGFVSTLWEYWPIYLLLILISYTWVRSIRESREPR